MEESQATEIKSRSNSENRPIVATPAEWPNPQRQPDSQACEDLRTAKGAMAVRWSKPVKT